MSEFNSIGNSNKQANNPIIQKPKQTKSTKIQAPSFQKVHSKGSPINNNNMNRKSPKYNSNDIYQVEEEPTVSQPRGINNKMANLIGSKQTQKTTKSSKSSSNIQKQKGSKNEFSDFVARQQQQLLLMDQQASSQPTSTQILTAPYSNSSLFQKKTLLQENYEKIQLQQQEQTKNKNAKNSGQVKPGKKVSKKHKEQSQINESHNAAEVTFQDSETITAKMNKRFIQEQQLNKKGKKLLEERDMMNSSMPVSKQTKNRKETELESILSKSAKVIKNDIQVQSRNNKSSLDEDKDDENVMTNRTTHSPSKPMLMNTQVNLTSPYFNKQSPAFSKLPQKCTNDTEDVEVSKLPLRTAPRSSEQVKKLTGQQQIVAPPSNQVEATGDCDLVLDVDDDESIVVNQTIRKPTTPKAPQLNLDQKKASSQVQYEQKTKISNTNTRNQQQQLSYPEFLQSNYVQNQQEPKKMYASHTSSQVFLQSADITATDLEDTQVAQDQLNKIAGYDKQKQRPYLFINNKRKAQNLTPSNKNQQTVALNPKNSLKIKVDLTEINDDSTNSNNGKGGAESTTAVDAKTTNKQQVADQKQQSFKEKNRQTFQLQSQVEKKQPPTTRHFEADQSKQFVQIKKISFTKTDQEQTPKSQGSSSALSISARRGDGKHRKLLDQKQVNFATDADEVDQNYYEDSNQDEAKKPRSRSNLRTESLERILGDRADSYFQQLEMTLQTDFGSRSSLSRISAQRKQSITPRLEKIKEEDYGPQKVIPLNKSQHLKNSQTTKGIKQDKRKKILNQLRQNSPIAQMQTKTNDQIIQQPSSRNAKFIDVNGVVQSKRSSQTSNTNGSASFRKSINLLKKEQLLQQQLNDDKNDSSWMLYVPNQPPKQVTQEQQQQQQQEKINSLVAEDKSEPNEILQNKLQDLKEVDNVAQLEKVESTAQIKSARVLPDLESKRNKQEERGDGVITPVLSKHLLIIDNSKLQLTETVNKEKKQQYYIDDGKAGDDTITQTIDQKDHNQALSSSILSLNDSQFTLDSRAANINKKLSTLMHETRKKMKQYQKKTNNQDYYKQTQSSKANQKQSSTKNSATSTPNADLDMAIKTASIDNSKKRNSNKSTKDNQTRLPKHNFRPDSNVQQNDKELLDVCQSPEINKYDNLRKSNLQDFKQANYFVQEDQLNQHQKKQYQYQSRSSRRAHSLQSTPMKGRKEGESSFSSADDLDILVASRKKQQHKKHGKNMSRNPKRSQQAQNFYMKPSSSHQSLSNHQQQPFMYPNLTYNQQQQIFIQPQVAPQTTNNSASIQGGIPCIYYPPQHPHDQQQQQQPLLIAYNMPQQQQHQPHHHHHHQNACCFTTGPTNQNIPQQQTQPIIIGLNNNNQITPLLSPANSHTTGGGMVFNNPHHHQTQLYNNPLTQQQRLLDTRSSLNQHHFQGAVNNNFQ